MGAESENRGGRKALDEIMGQLAKPDFELRHRRLPAMPETGAHVCPEMLALSPPRSRYVRRWRRHARHCLACANVFRYFGLSVD